MAVQNKLFYFVHLSSENKKTKKPAFINFSKYICIQKCFYVIIIISDFSYLYFLISLGCFKHRRDFFVTIWQI